MPNQRSTRAGTYRRQSEGFDAFIPAQFPPTDLTVDEGLMVDGSVFFPVEQLPEWVRPVSDLLPITWSLRIIRGSLLRGLPSSELIDDLMYLAGLTVILLPLGIVFSRIAIRKAKREGSLIQY